MAYHRGKDEDHTDSKGALDAIRIMKEHHPEKTGKPFFLAMDSSAAHPASRQRTSETVSGRQN